MHTSAYDLLLGYISLSTIYIVVILRACLFGKIFELYRYFLILYFFYELIIVLVGVDMQNIMMVIIPMITFMILVFLLSA